MAAPVKINLSTLSGPWQVISITEGAGAGTSVNLDFTMIPALLNSGNQWTSDTLSVTRHTNGDWLIKSGSTVLYRKTGSKAWPWSAGTWTGENSATGTIVLEQKNAEPVSSAEIIPDYPPMLTVSGVLAAPINGSWMNGGYARTTDELSLPAWQRVDPTTRRGLIRCNDPAGPYYEIAWQTRATAEDPWEDGQIVFVADNPSRGMPWRVGWAEDGDYSGDVIVEASPLPPEKVTI